MTDAANETTKGTKGTKDPKDTEDTKTRKTLACGCEVEAARDFLGRVVGTVITKGETCAQALHIPAAVVVMPGREHARPE